MFRPDLYDSPEVDGEASAQDGETSAQDGETSAQDGEVSAQDGEANAQADGEADAQTEPQPLPEPDPGVDPEPDAPSHHGEAKDHEKSNEPPSVQDAPGGPTTSGHAKMIKRGRHGPGLLYPRAQIRQEVTSELKLFARGKAVLPRLFNRFLGNVFTLAAVVADADIRRIITRHRNPVVQRKHVKQVLDFLVYHHALTGTYQVVLDKNRQPAASRLNTEHAKLTKLWTTGGLNRRTKFAPYRARGRIVYGPYFYGAKSAVSKTKLWPKRRSSHYWVNKRNLRVLPGRIARTTDPRRKQELRKTLRHTRYNLRPGPLATARTFASSVHDFLNALGGSFNVTNYARHEMGEYSVDLYLPSSTPSVRRMHRRKPKPYYTHAEAIKFFTKVDNLAKRGVPPYGKFAWSSIYGDRTAIVPLDGVFGRGRIIYLADHDHPNYHIHLNLRPVKLPHDKKTGYKINSAGRIEVL